MAKFEIFQSPGGTIRIQVPDDDGPGGAKDVTEIARVVSAMGQALGAQMEQFEDLDNPPGEVVVTFGIKVFAGGAAAVSLDHHDANFKVEFKWSAGGGDTGELI